MRFFNIPAGVNDDQVVADSMDIHAKLVVMQQLVLLRLLPFTTCRCLCYVFHASA
jgi:hypothetical protein